MKTRPFVLPLALLLAAGFLTRAASQDAPAQASDDSGGHEGDEASSSEAGQAQAPKVSDDADSPGSGGDSVETSEHPIVSIKVESDEKPARAAVTVVPRRKKAVKPKASKTAKAKAKAAVKTPPAVKKAVASPPPPPPPPPAVPSTPVEPLNP